jgi:ribosomal protein L24
MCEIKKRCQNIIIHGITEPAADANREQRKKQDEDQIAELFHQIDCDDVSMQGLDLKDTTVIRPTPDHSRQYCHLKSKRTRS